MEETNKKAQKGSSLALYNNTIQEKIGIKMSWYLPSSLPTTFHRRIVKKNGNLRILGADLTAADAWAEVSGLQSLTLGPFELRLLLDGGQPEAQLVGEIVTRSACSITLDERCSAEILQTRAGARQRLAATFRTSCRVLFYFLKSQLQSSKSGWKLKYFRFIPWRSCNRSTDCPSLPDNLEYSPTDCGQRWRLLELRKRRTFNFQKTNKQDL